MDTLNSRVHQNREAILLTLCDPLPAECERLRRLSVREWQRLLPWLDRSGLALYFLDRLAELELTAILPSPVLTRLQQNLADNTVRTDSMIAEAAAIHAAFQQARLSYATLKGFSLWPLSVPRLELRSQLDLDFLIAEKCVVKARHILEARGYRLHAISGNAWEFKSDGECIFSLNSLYKPMPQRSVELHVEPVGSACITRLSRTERRLFHEVSMPVLSAVDLFLDQGMHLAKHIASEFSRTAHLIEFRRHILARHHEDAFWNCLRQRAATNPKAPLALGLVILLITRLMGDFAPSALTTWTVDCLPTPARLWVEMYGRQAVYGPSPNKLYLLLQPHLEITSEPGKRSLRQSLLPLRLPMAVSYPTARETAPARVRRYATQLRFIAFRLRFHTFEGLRYLLESIRFRIRLTAGS